MENVQDDAFSPFTDNGLLEFRWDKWHLRFDFFVERELSVDRKTTMRSSQDNACIFCKHSSNHVLVPEMETKAVMSPAMNASILHVPNHTDKCCFSSLISSKFLICNRLFKYCYSFL